MNSLLHNLTSLEARRRKSEQDYVTEQLRLVKFLRHEKVTWQQIGDALGITRQAAHQRFSSKGNGYKGVRNK